MKLKRIFCTAAMLMAMGFGPAAWAQHAITRTTVAQGEVQGVEEDGLGLFKAIPYAEPPVGNLRWKAPVPLKKWDGVLQATEYAKMPPQQTRQRPGDDAPAWSEDCLYIQVMTPAQRTDEKLPVMVWIHGGGFITGSYCDTPANNLAKRGVVVASIEYRTGALGFLALPELSKESGRGVSGNYGLMDQILALQWIKDNIAAFGGDPDKVTIFGESAGGISVSMLCASPKAKGLFRAAISQSGGSFCPVDSVRRNNNGIRDVKGAEAFGVEFMKRIGAKNLKQLRKMSPEAWIADNATTGVGGFWPTVDGEVITDDQFQLYSKGEYNDVDVLIGTNSDEGSLFVRPSSVADYEAEIRSAYGTFADRVLKAYPATTEKETYFARADIFRETAFAWPTYTWARLQKQTGKGRVFVYYLDQPGGLVFGPEKPRGATHVADIPFVFGLHWGAPEPVTDAMSEIMQEYWVNFAKHGTPNAKGLPFWPEFEENKPTVMMFRDGAHLIEHPNMPLINLMDEFYAWKRSQR